MVEKRVSIAVHDEQRELEPALAYTVPLPGRHLVADVDQISALHERGVLLSVDRQMLRPALRSVAKVPRPTREQALEHPIQATLRRLWDRITRPR